jgi:hypothetical protein
VNEVLTPNDVVKLFGNSITISGDNADFGLWFVSESVEEAKESVITQNNRPLLMQLYRHYCWSLYAEGGDTMLRMQFIKTI